MKINMLLNRINEFADVRMCKNAHQYKELKATLRQLRKASRELEQEIYGVNRGKVISRSCMRSLRELHYSVKKA